MSLPSAKILSEPTLLLLEYTSVKIESKHKIFFQDFELEIIVCGKAAISFRHQWLHFVC